MLGKSVRYKDSFLYGSKNLIGKNGIIMNADCHLDKGFEYLDNKNYAKKTMYSLTRHGPSANRGPCTVADICGPDILIKGFMMHGCSGLLTPLAALFTWFFIPAGFTMSHGY